LAPVNKTAVVRSAGGTDSVEIAVINSSLSVSEAIDEDGDGRIGDFEILQAIEYWRTSAEVPDTSGETIGDFEILELIELWRTNAEVTA
jgi:hypothetical protein